MPCCHSGSVICACTHLLIKRLDRHHQCHIQPNLHDTLTLQQQRRQHQSLVSVNRQQLNPCPGVRKGPVVQVVFLHEMSGQGTGENSQHVLHLTAKQYSVLKSSMDDKEARSVSTRRCQLLSNKGAVVILCR